MAFGGRRMLSVGWAWGEGEGNKLRVISFVTLWNSVVNGVPD